MELRALDGRLGSEVRLSIPIYRLLRGMVAVEGEVAPGAFGNADRRIHPDLAPLPVYGVGVSAGLEVEIP